MCVTERALGVLQWKTTKTWIIGGGSAVCENSSGEPGETTFLKEQLHKNNT